MHYSALITPLLTSFRQINSFDVVEADSMSIKSGSKAFSVIVVTRKYILVYYCGNEEKNRMNRNSSVLNGHAGFSNLHSLSRHN